MDTLFYDLRLAARALLRRRGFAVAAVLTLALGVGATTALFSLVNGILLRALPYPEADRLVSIWMEEVRDPDPALGGLIPVPEVEDIRAEVGALEAVAQYAGRNLTLTGIEAAEVVPGGRVSRDFFRVFHASPVLGREFTEEEDRYNGPAVAVVSHGFWRERLGARPDVLGSTIELAGVPHAVVGVAPDGFDAPGGARVWVPMQNDPDGCGRGCYIYQAAGRLAPGATLEGARAELTALAVRLESIHDENAETTIRASRLRDVIVGDVRQAMIVLFLAVGMVLLIACANVANLVLARGATRSGEMAVRAALGAGRPRLVRQVLAESLVLAVVAGGVGVALAFWGVDVLKLLSPGDIPRLDEVAVDATALLFALGLVLLTPLVFGLVPALRLARVSLGDTLRQGGRSDGAGARTGTGRKTLLVAEVGLSLMLLLGAGLMLQSFARMQSVDPGFRTKGLALFNVTLPSARYDTEEEVVLVTQRLRDELAVLPGVESATAGVGVPLSGMTLVGGFTRMDRPPPERGQGPGAKVNYTGADYFSTLDIRLLSGRLPDQTDRYGTLPVVVISRGAAEEHWPGESPIGKQVDLQISVGYPEDQPRTVIGVVEDVRSDALVSEPRPEMYVPIAQAAPSFGTFVLSTAGDPSALLQAARNTLREVDADLPMASPRTMAEQVDAQLARPRFYFLLIGLFAALALSLALVGIYGVVAYVVSQRTQEIGVRTALGATPREVVRLVLGQGLRPALAGAAIGLLGAVLGGRFLSGMLYDIRPTDPATMAGATALLLAAVLLACVVPARRAARISPVRALRQE